MLESQIISNSLSIVDLAKTIKKEILLSFAKEYLNKHAYISSKKLSTSYLNEYYKLSYRDSEYIQISRILSHKFRHTIMLLTQERLIVGYNNSSLYKRVDIPISLDNDMSKTDPDTNSKIDCEILQKNLRTITKPGLETKSNEVKLVYYQGKFINPKFL